MKYEYTSEDFEFRTQPLKLKAKTKSNCFLQFIEKLKTNKKMRIITIIIGSSILLLIVMIILIVVLTKKKDENPSISGVSESPNPIKDIKGGYLILNYLFESKDDKINIINIPQELNEDDFNVNKINEYNTIGIRNLDNFCQNGKIK